MRLYDNATSGNGYKVRLLLALLGTDYERIEMDTGHGETRTPRNTCARIRTAAFRCLNSAMGVCWPSQMPSCFILRATRPFCPAILGNKRKSCN